VSVIDTTPHTPTVAELEDLFTAPLPLPIQSPEIPAPLDFADRAADLLLESARIPEYARTTVAAALRAQYTAGYWAGVSAHG
jgi:hypothetical protein